MHRVSSSIIRRGRRIGVCSLIVLTAAAGSVGAASPSPNVDEDQIVAALAGVNDFFTSNYSPDPLPVPCPGLSFEQLVVLAGPAGLTLTRQGYFVELQAEDGIGRGFACGTILQDALDQPDPAAPNAAYLRVWDNSNGAFSDFLELLDVPADVIVPAPIGGETAGECYDAEGTPVCLVAWHQSDLAVSLAVMGPGVDRARVDNLLITAIPAILTNLGAYGQPAGAPPTVAVPTPPLATTAPSDPAGVPVPPPPTVAPTG